jgi:hypothetical protein
MAERAVGAEQTAMAKLDVRLRVQEGWEGVRRGM